MASHVFQSPTGTRDMYPIEAARRRFIMEAWRRVSINHGFEEIDGPTFEHLDLYKVKSGEGIVNELFSFTRAGGEKDYALRPEFTPTLARMYAAKAASLPKPTKWFTAGPFFRAERPQRGRLREFLQWNVDYIGAGESAGSVSDADAEIISVCVEFLRSLGLSERMFQVHISDRRVLNQLLKFADVCEENMQRAVTLLDKATKLHKDEYAREALAIGLNSDKFEALLEHAHDAAGMNAGGFALTAGECSDAEADVALDSVKELNDSIRGRGIEAYCKWDFSLARGLAYYTGMVFEVIVDGERAVAGGGRYDNLIELFGGPPTPAVGFGMGDVVLSLVLQDKGLMPSDDELMGIAGQNPDVFVISNGTPEADAVLPSVLANLRRGSAASSDSSLASRPSPLDRGLHVRRSYKTTKNVGKLLQDAVKVRARFAVIIESAAEATIKDLKTGAQDQSRTPLDGVAAEIRKRLNT